MARNILRGVGRFLFRRGFVLAWVGFLAAGAVQAAPDVTGVRIGEHSAGARFVVDISERVEYRTFTLSNPYRVVIDLPRVAWRIETDAPVTGRGVVSAFRFGLFTPDTTRIVLDVKAPVKIERTFVLEPGDSVPHHRLVVDLERVSVDQFRASQGNQPPPPQPGTGTESAPTPRPEPPGKKLIVLDPGHGGVDPGALGVRGTREKEITLGVARALQDVLEATGRYDVRLTRDGDFYVPLRERFALARRMGARLFVSLHADAHNSANVRGASVYTLSETASDAEAAALAAKENRSDAIAGVDLSGEDDDVADILIDLAQRETMNLSAAFAEILVEELGKEIELLRNTHRFAGFAVLKAPDVPSVLVELGYLTNRVDEMQLRKDSHRRKIAQALVEAIDKYFAEQDRLSKS